LCSPDPSPWAGAAWLASAEPDGAGPDWADPDVADLGWADLDCADLDWAASVPRTVTPARVRLRTRDLRGGWSVRAPWSLRRAGRFGDRGLPVSPTSSSSSASSPARPRSARGRLPFTPAGMSSSSNRCAEVE